MSFKSPKQRAFYFAKKSGKPKGLNPQLAPPAPAQVSPTASPQQTIQTTPTFKIPGLPKMGKFGRIKKNFKY